MKRGWGQNDFLTALNFWKETVYWSRKVCGMLSSNQYIEIRYEDLVLEPEKVLIRVTNFLNLPYEYSMIKNYMKRTNAKIPKYSIEYHSNLFKKPDPSNVRKWVKSLSKTDQTISHEIAGDLFAELRYPPGNIESSSIAKLYKRLYWVMVHAFNWRMRNIKRKMNFRLHY